eukprot:gene28761-31943_t
MGNQLPPELPPVFTAVLDFATLSCMSLGARELTKALELCTLILPPLPSRPPLLGLGPQQVLGPQKGLDLQQDLGPVHSVNQPSSSHKRASPQPHGLDRSEGLPSTQPSSSRKSAPHQLPMLDQAVARLVQRACVQLRYEVGSLSLRDIVVVKEACSRTHQVDEPLHTAMSQRAEALLQQGRSKAGLHQVQRARPLQVSELDAGLLVRLALAVSTSGRSNPALLSSIADALLQAAPVAAESSSTLSPLPAGRLQAIPAQAASNSLSPLPQPHPSPEGHLQSIHPISSTLSPSPQPTHSVTDLAASLVTQLSPLSILQLLHAYQAAQHHAPHLFMAAGNALADMLASAAPASRQGVDMLDSAAQAARLASAFAQLGVSNPPLFDRLASLCAAQLLGELAPRRGTATGEQHPGEEQQQLLGELAPRRGTATAARQVEQDYGAASGKSTAIADMAGKLLSSPVALQQLDSTQWQSAPHALVQLGKLVSYFCTRSTVTPPYHPNPEALQQLDSTQWQSALHALVQLGHSQTTTYANLGARGAALVRSSWSGAELVGALHAFASIPHASKPLMNTISRYLVLKSSSLQPEEVLCALEAMRDLAPPHDLKLFRALALSVHQKLGSYSTAQLLHIVAISLEMRLYHARLVTDVVRRYLSESSHPGVSPASITQLRDLALASSMGEPSDAVAIRKLGDQATLALCKPALSGEPGPTPLQLAELVWAFSGHASPHAELLEAAEAVLVSSIPELSTRAKLRVAQAYSHREARGSAGLVEALGRDVQKWLESLVVDHQPDRHAAELAPGASLLHWKPGGGWVPSGAPVGQDGDASECSLDPVGVMNQGSDKERLGRRHERGGMQLHGRLEEEEEEGWLEAADVPEGDYFSQVGVACSCSGQVDISFFTILATWAAGRAGAARSGQECSALSVALSSFLKFSAAAEALSPRWQGFGTANLGMCTPGQQLGGLQGGEDAAALAAVLNALHVLAQDARRLSSGWSDTTQLEQLIRGLATSVEQIEELQHQLQLQKNSSMKSDPSLDSTTDQLGDQIQQQISPSTSLDPASDPAICRIQHHVHSDSSSDKGGSDTDSRAPSVRGVDEENRFSLGMLADATWAEDKDSEALRDVRQALSGALQVVGNRLAIVLETRARYRQTRQYHKREF